MKLIYRKRRQPLIKGQLKKFNLIYHTFYFILSSIMFYSVLLRKAAGAQIIQWKQFSEIVTINNNTLHKL